MMGFRIIRRGCTPRDVYVGLVKSVFLRKELNIDLVLSDLGLSYVPFLSTINYNGTFIFSCTTRWFKKERWVVVTKTDYIVLKPKSHCTMRFDSEQGEFICSYYGKLHQQPFSSHTLEVVLCRG